MAICGAKTRSGGACQKHGMANGRCRLHGGASTGRPATPGSIYSQYLTDEEKADFDRVELGTVDEELRLCRVQLARVLKAAQKNSSGETDPKEEVKDYSGRMNMLLGRIESLERTRAELAKVETPDDGEVLPVVVNVQVVDARK